MDKILELLGLSQFTQPKAHDNIDSLMQDNTQQPLASRETSIGPIPPTVIGKGGLSEQDILEMIMPFGGMGRVAKAGTRVGRGIVDAMKRRGSAGKVAVKKAGTEDETLAILKRQYDKPARELEKYDELFVKPGQRKGNYFKNLLDNLFESFEGKEF